MKKREAAVLSFIAENPGSTFDAVSAGCGLDELQTVIAVLDLGTARRIRVGGVEGEPVYFVRNSADEKKKDVV